MAAAAAGDEDQGERAKSDVADDDVFEQRRVRHIASILIRNLTIPTANTAEGKAPLHRPRPRRSISTASISSAGTVKRASSTKSQGSRSRARASSIASTRSNGFETSAVFTSDLAALRTAVEARLCQTFITLTRIEDGTEVFRTATSGSKGVDFGWGRCAGSLSDPDGLPLTLLDDQVGSEDSMQVTVWYRRESGADKGKAREAGSPVVVELGAEEQSGWAVLWQQNVHLKRLVEVPSTSYSLCPPNTLLFGLCMPLSQVQPVGKEEEQGLAESGPGMERKTIGGTTAIQGDQVRYYTASEAPQAARGGSGEKREERKVRGYEVEDVLRLLQLQRELYQTICDGSAAVARADAILEGEQGPIANHLHHAEDQERLAVLRGRRDAVQESIKAKRRLVQERSEGINRRRARLEIARRAMAKERTSYKELQGKLSQLALLSDSIRAKAYGRRATLLQQLEFIYPVELVDGATLLFSIVDIPLPNRVVEEEKEKSSRGDDDVVSSALGMIGQVVGLMSVYLATPLHYPIATAGSRSVIQDSISVMSGPRTFPLYSKGVEAYRFEYAMFLLNKDIEQLMNRLGITIVDIRNTLPNLKNLLLISSGG